MWAIWASQNCKDFDLTITLVFDERAINNLVGFVGDDNGTTDNPCSNNYFFEDVVVCKYTIKALSANFGLLFQGGFSPVFYETEWSVSDTFVPDFNWW